MVNFSNVFNQAQSPTQSQNEHRKPATLQREAATLPGSVNINIPENTTNSSAENNSEASTGRTTPLSQQQQQQQQQRVVNINPLVNPFTTIDLYAIRDRQLPRPRENVSEEGAPASEHQQSPPTIAVVSPTPPPPQPAAIAQETNNGGCKWPLNQRDTLILVAVGCSLFGLGLGLGLGFVLGLKLSSANGQCSPNVTPTQLQQLATTLSLTPSLKNALLTFLPTLVPKLIPTPTNPPTASPTLKETSTNSDTATGSKKPTITGTESNTLASTDSATASPTSKKTGSDTSSPTNSLVPTRTRSTTPTFFRSSTNNSSLVTNPLTPTPWITNTGSFNVTAFFNLSSISPSRTKLPSPLASAQLLSPSTSHTPSISQRSSLELSKSLITRLIPIGTATAELTKNLDPSQSYICQVYGVNWSEIIVYIFRTSCELSGKTLIEASKSNHDDYSIVNCRFPANLLGIIDATSRCIQGKVTTSPTPIATGSGNPIPITQTPGQEDPLQTCSFLQDIDLYQNAPDTIANFTTYHINPPSIKCQLPTSIIKKADEEVNKNEESYSISIVPPTCENDQPGVIRFVYFERNNTVKSCSDSTPNP